MYATEIWATSGLGNGLLHGQRQAITWTTDVGLLIVILFRCVQFSNHLADPCVNAGCGGGDGVYFKFIFFTSIQNYLLLSCCRLYRDVTIWNSFH